VIALAFGDVKVAFYLLIALVPALLLHEYAHARVSEKLGDWTPRRYGRATLNPRPHVDPLGTVILPGFLLVLFAAGAGAIPFAYAKPMPYNPAGLRNPRRDTVLVALAGPGVNLAVGLAAGLALRVVGGGSEDLAAFLFGLLLVNVFMGVFQLMPIPGLDGSRILARYLSGRAREVYTNLDQFLPLFMLLIFFLLAAPVLGFVNIFTDALCELFTAGGCPL
jgi:Zn-dependent protease